MCFLGWMYPAVWEMMSHWSSLKQRENCCSPYSFNLPPVFPTYSTLCTLAGQSCPFVFFFITFISLPLSLHELSISFFPSCFYLPHRRYSVLLSPSLLFRSFPLFAPPWSVSLPPSHSPALPLFLCLLSLFCLLCVCVCMWLYFSSDWLTREMFSCCWALEEAAWQNYSSVRNTQRRIHVVCPSVRRQGAVSNSGNLERFQNFKCVHEF